MYKNYIFDLYGTLLDIRTDENNMSFWVEVADSFLKRGAIYNPVELKHKYFMYVKKEKAKVKLSHPTYKYIDIDLLNVFANLFKYKGITLTQEQLKNVSIEFRTSSTIFILKYDGVDKLLSTLKEHHKKVFLLSNAQSSFTINELLNCQIYDYFDGILISSDAKCSKPDVHFFQKLFDKYSLKKEESIMIGNDYKSDINGAYNFGIDSLYIHQEISSPIEGIKLKSKWSILDGDVNKILPLILSKGGCHEKQNFNS